MKDPIIIWESAHRKTKQKTDKTVCSVWSQNLCEEEAEEITQSLIYNNSGITGISSIQPSLSTYYVPELEVWETQKWVR